MANLFVPTKIRNIAIIAHVDHGKTTLVDGLLKQSKTFRDNEAELKPIFIINKIDKPGSRICEVEDELADLFLELAVHEDQLHYPVYYAIGREGKAWKTIPENPSAKAD